MNDVEEGMFVTSTDGQRMGKVIRCDTETFVVEKGTLFPKDYELRYEYVQDIKDGGIVYMLSEDLARSGSAAKSSVGEKVASLPGAAAAAAAAVAAKAKAAVSKEVGAKDRAESAEATREALSEHEGYATSEHERAAFSSSDEEELRIPLLREEMDIEKFSRESGHVKIHKAVHTEEKHFSVPLRREELIIEHIASSTRESALDAAGAFEEGTLDITLQEEDVRVGKHAVLREEVVVRKVARAIEKDASASLRSEDLEIEDTRLPSAAIPKASGYAPASPTRH
jgi:uncharacterized protein (TIGR02271 family)